VRVTWSAGPQIADADVRTHHGAHGTVIESIASIAGAVWMVEPTDAEGLLVARGQMGMHNLERLS
jgi:hypothetical protein